MDQELKQYLQGMESRMESRLEARLGSFESRIEGRLDTRLDTLKTELKAEIEKSETNLLTAFHGWARPMEIRVNGVTVAAAGFDERLALAEERISKLERRKSS